MVVKIGNVASTFVETNRSTSRTTMSTKNAAERWSQSPELTTRTRPTEGMASSLEPCPPPHFFSFFLPLIFSASIEHSRESGYTPLLFEACRPRNIHVSGDCIRMRRNKLRSPSSRGLGGAQVGVGGGGAEEVRIEI